MVLNGSPCDRLTAPITGVALVMLIAAFSLMCTARHAAAKTAFLVSRLEDEKIRNGNLSFRVLEVVKLLGVNPNGVGLARLQFYR